MIEHPDKALTRRMSRGAQDAFDEFFNSYFPRLYRFTLNRVGTNDDLIGEIVQRTLCRAIEKIDSYRGEASLFTWLCRLCRNEISDHFRRHSREAARTVDFDDTEMRTILESLDEGDTEPDARVQRQQVVLLIQTILDHLPARQGNVLEWKYIQGLTVDEIAARLQVTHAAAQSLLARARQSFRDGFADMTDTELDMLLR